MQTRQAIFSYHYESVDANDEKQRAALHALAFKHVSEQDDLQGVKRAWLSNKGPSSHDRVGICHRANATANLHHTMAFE